MRVKAWGLVSALVWGAFFAEAGALEVNVQLRWYHQFQFAGFYAALEQGYYRDAGLDVRLIEGSLEISPVEEVLAKRAHFGVANANLVVDYLSGKPVVLLAPVFQHSPNALMLLPSRGYETPADLAFGAPVVTLGGSEDVELRSIFAVEGIRLETVRFKTEGDLSDLVKGRIGALNVYTSNEPYLMRQRGLDYRLLRPQNYGMDFYGDLLFTADWMIRKHPEAVKAFKEATLKGWRYAFAHPEETVDLILERYRPPAKTRDHLLFEAAELTRLSSPEVIDVGHNNPGRWAGIAQTLVHAGVAPKMRDLDGFFYNPDPAPRWLYPVLGAAVFILLLFLFYQTRLRRAFKRESAGRRLSEAGYQTLFESSPEGISIIDDRGTFKRCNPAAARMLGFSPAELEGKNVLEISPDIQPETDFFSEAAAKLFLEKGFAGEPQHFEWAHLDKTGETVLIEVLLAPFGPAENRELLVLWRDVTNLRKLQREKKLQEAVLIQQTKLAELGSMIGAIAHQWKQPLNAIALTAQDLPDALEAGELEGGGLQKRVERIMNQIRFMAQTVDDFRNFYKPAKEAAPFSPKTAVLSVVELLKTQLSRHRVNVIVEGDESLKAMGFIGEFKQVVLNLINNSRDAAQERKIPACTLHIGITRQADRIIIGFRDNAGGIPEKMLPKRIFEPFVSTKGDQGTGIGLSLAKTIIEEKMHGRLSAENVEGGALFTIELPLFKETA